MPNFRWERSDTHTYTLLSYLLGTLLSQQGNGKTAREDSGGKFPLSKTPRRADLTNEEKAYGPRNSTMRVFTLRASETLLAATAATLSLRMSAASKSGLSRKKLLLNEQRQLQLNLDVTFTWPELVAVSPLPCPVPAPNTHSRRVGNVYHTETEQMFTENLHTDPRKISLMKKSFLANTSQQSSRCALAPWPYGALFRGQKGPSAADRCCCFAVL